MKVIDLINFFINTGYIWKKDEESLKIICKLTKTRVKQGYEDFIFTAGHEQPFFMKALAEHINAKNFFEIGTGRGTACYTLSLIEDLKEIITVDIVPHDEKYKTAIDFKPAFVSNKDIDEMIPFEEKEKINFLHRNELHNFVEKNKNKFDLCFIDGDHDNHDIIYNDFEICSAVVKEDGVIVFDDYQQDRYSVKSVVDRILDMNPDLNAFLITTSGHLFEMTKKVNDAGMVVVSKREII